ncbi:MAG: ABC transporter ATP-binding protein/permease [Verrucomicrobia bacterium]|jgi:ABC-type multidrug transport system fused ATPase/permease subunit|nr:ABC transporter ATP-binding protein/permease [Verrucomicrobiota bacterium]
MSHPVVVNPSRIPPLQRLWTLVKAEPRALGRGVFFQFWQTASYIPFYAAVAFFIDKVLNNAALTLPEKLKWTGVYALANLLLWPVHGWFTVMAFAETQRLVRSTVARLRRLVVDQLQRMSMSYFTRKGAGALSNQMTVDLNRVETFLALMVNQITTAVLIGAGTLVYLLLKNPALAALACLAAPIQILLLRIMGGRVKRASASLQQSGEVFSARIVEFIAGMRLTKSFGNEIIAAEQLSRDIEDLKQRGYEASILLRWLSMGVQFIWEYTSALLWCVGGALYLHGRISLGDLVAFMGLIGFVRQGMMSFFNAYESWSQARPGMEAIVELLDSDELEGFQTVQSDVEVRGAITIKDVEFRYPRAESKPVLQDINLEIPAGQRIGLVGETGAGKSTLLELIMGFYQPARGEIRYDGRLLSEIGLRQLRRHIAILSQDAFIWNATVLENIRYGRPGATDAEVREAAAKAQADAFVCALPEGYQTVCGERGSKLSGGQRQRIALARVFLRNPRIVVLDEPTSALDVETEARLLEDLDQLCAGRTTFIVAHRLSTLRDVDRVLVFSQGRIVEDGPPSELLGRAGGHFRRLHELQDVRAAT